jgi:hypothetical protein
MLTNYYVPPGDCVAGAAGSLAFTALPAAATENPVSAATCRQTLGAPAARCCSACAACARLLMTTCCSASVAEPLRWARAGTNRLDTCVRAPLPLPATAPAAPSVAGGTVAVAKIIMCYVLLNTRRLAGAGWRGWRRVARLTRARRAASSSRGADAERSPTHGSHEPVPVSVRTSLSRARARSLSLSLSLPLSHHYVGGQPQTVSARHHATCLRQCESI